MFVKIPQDTLLAGLGDQRPRDYRPAELFADRIGDSRNRGVPRPRVVVQKLAVRLAAEGRIPRGAEDQAVPRLIDRTRRHPDYLAVP